LIETPLQAYGHSVLNGDSLFQNKPILEMIRKEVKNFLWNLYLSSILLMGWIWLPLLIESGIEVSLSGALGAGDHSVV
jgi:hypothetical protein